MPSIGDALGSIPSVTKKKERERRGCSCLALKMSKKFCGKAILKTVPQILSIVNIHFKVIAINLYSVRIQACLTASTGKLINSRKG